MQSYYASLLSISRSVLSCDLNVRTEPVEAYSISDMDREGAAEISSQLGIVGRAPPE